MTITYRMLLACMVPAALICVVGLYATRTSRGALLDAERRSVSRLAASVADEIAQLVEARASFWTAWVRSPQLRDALRDVNLARQTRPDAATYRERVDTAWRAAQDPRELPEYSEVTQCALALELTSGLGELVDRSRRPVFVEVFLTDAAGGNVAQTGLTTDFLQSDEAWWQTAVERGSHVTEISFDQSAGALSAAICVRVDDDDGRLLGVLKAVWSSSEIADLLASKVSADRDAPDPCSLSLYTSDGTLVHTAGAGPAAPRQLAAADPARRTAGAGGDAAPQDSTLTSIVAVNPQDRSAAGGAGRLGWWLRIDQDTTSTIRDIAALDARVMLLAGLAVLMAWGIGGALAMTLVRRLHRLTEATAAITRGDFDGVVPVSGRDELAVLARRVEAMWRDIEESHADLERKASVLTTHNQTLRDDADERARMEQERAEMEVQLRQAQRLEAIGQLAAGVAHEINTPIQYVADNVRFLERSVQSLSRVTAVARIVVDASSKELACPPERIETLQRILEEEEADFLQEEIPAAVSETLEGINRVATIVRAMKEFSHPSGHGKQSADINRAILTTVTIARNEWKYVADVVTDLDPGLPPIPVLIDRLNQVFLNLVVNAAHAIEDARSARGESAKGEIRIATAAVDDGVEIRIKDSGCGIPEDVADKVFHPFFTTKQVGRGTGQGLSMAHDVIVKRHGGRIGFSTEPGAGTEFVVWLPADRVQEPDECESAEPAVTLEAEA